MSDRIRRANALVCRLEEEFAILAFYALLVALIAQVFVRFVLRFPLPWTEEIARFTFVWMSAAGAAIALRKGSHFIAVPLVDAVSGAGRRALEALVRLVIACVVIVLLVEGIHLADLGRTQLTPILGMPVAYVYAAVPVMAALMLWHIVVAAVLGADKSHEFSFFGNADGEPR